MGDRGNIKLVGKETFPAPVYLYTHWDDGPYLSRIIFQQLIGKDESITGYGLSTDIGDNEHPLLVVDVDENTVWEEPDNRDDYHIGLRKDSLTKPVSFEDYLSAQSALT